MFDTERVWANVEPVSLTANGTAGGLATVTDVNHFKVGQEVVLTADTLPDLLVQVKRVVSKTKLCLGEKGKGIKHRSNLSAYTVALNSKLAAAEQEKVTIPLVDIQRSVYAEEPTMAYRNLLVDEYGQPYTTDNPLKVQLSDGNINIGTVNANVDVQLTDKESTVGANDYDITRIGNGVNQLDINNDGSLNVNVVSSPSASPGLEYNHNEVTSIATGVETTLIYILGSPIGKKVYKIEVSGENIALYRVKINGTTQFTKRTYFGGSLNESFSFDPFENGLKLGISDTLTVTVLHQRPNLGNFETTVTFINL